MLLKNQRKIAPTHYYTGRSYLVVTLIPLTYAPIVKVAMPDALTRAVA